MFPVHQKSSLRGPDGTQRLPSGQSRRCQMMSSAIAPSYWQVERSRHKAELKEERWKTPDRNHTHKMCFFHSLVSVEYFLEKGNQKYWTVNSFLQHSYYQMWNVLLTCRISHRNQKSVCFSCIATQSTNYCKNQISNIWKILQQQSAEMLLQTITADLPLRPFLLISDETIDHRWVNWRDRYISLTTYVWSLLDLFLKDATFRYCSPAFDFLPALSSSVFHLSRFLRVFFILFFGKTCWNMPHF